MCNSHIYECKLLGIWDAIYNAKDSLADAVGMLFDWAKGNRLCSKAVYEFFQPNGQNMSWASVVWSPCLVPKQAFIPWLYAKKKILTREKLFFLAINRFYPLCNATEESVHHIFFNAR